MLANRAYLLHFIRTVIQAPDLFDVIASGHLMRYKLSAEHALAPLPRVPFHRAAVMSALVLALSGCAGLPAPVPASGHLQKEPVATPKAGIPAPVMATPVLQAPKATAKTETYSVSVRNIPAQELLFAISRDAKLNIDLHPGIEGAVTINAIDQTLQQILTRVAKQVDMRWEVNGPNLTILPDKPFLRTYKIDFPNISRKVESSISTATQISGATTGGSASTVVTSNTKNDLMASLVENVTEILLEEDRLRYLAQIDTQVILAAVTAGTGSVSTGVSEGSKTRNTDGSKEAAGAGGGASGSGNQSIDSRGDAKKKFGEFELAKSVFANKETGVLIVRATSRQHEKVHQFIEQVMSAARRQVLIEATIVEVNLNNNFKQGINWQSLSNSSTGFSLTQAGSAGLTTANPLNIFTLAYAAPNSVLGNLSAEISLLESFGNVRVLSSPKLSVMNNQTATLKVADNKVYFTVTASSTTSNGVTQTNFSSTPNSVAVGFLMNVTPQISDGNEVTINLRPTITRITGYVNDPNPSLAEANVTNRVPEIRTREMESIIKVKSGQTAVMGGLMQDEISLNTDGVPGAASIPFFGDLFKHRNDSSNKTELVVFLRPIIIKDADISTDYSAFRDQLPDSDFFTRPIQGVEPK